MRRFLGCISLTSFPPPAPCSRLPPSLHWVPSGSVPQLPRYYAAAPTPCHPSRSARIPRRSVPVHRFFRSRLRPALSPPTGLGFGLPVPSPASFSGGGRASQVPGKPLCVPALLSDSGDPSSPGCYSDSVVPSARQTASAVARADFGAQSHGRHTCPLPPLLAPVTRGPWEGRFRLVANLGRAGLSPAGLVRKVSALTLRLHFPLPQASPGGSCRLPPDPGFL